MTDFDEIRRIIASRLTIARQQAGLSQAQSAKLLGMQRPSITEIEAGRRKVSAEELVAFSNIYRVEIEWLSGKDAGQVDEVRDKISLAARNLTKLNPDDLENVINLLTSLKPRGNS